MHLVIVHGYLLSGTGSNIYSCNVAMQWKKQGHAVTVFCQDPDAGTYPWVDEFFSVNDELPAEPPKAGVVRVLVADIAGLLPVYKYDEYKGYTTKTIQNCTQQEIDKHVVMMAKAIRNVVDKWGCDKVLANHAILQPLNVKRALEGTGIPFDIKIHGSAMTFVVEDNPTLYKPYAVEAINACNKVIAGTQHVVDQVLRNFPDIDLSQKLKIVPPGMDPDVFNLCTSIEENTKSFLKQCKVRNPGNEGRVASKIMLPTSGDCSLAFHQHLVNIAKTYNQRVVDADIESRFPKIAADEPILMFFGKFLYTKGIGEILITFFHLVKQQPKLRLILVGFGIYREHIEVMMRAMLNDDSALFKAAAHCIDEDGDSFIESSLDLDKYFVKIEKQEYDRVLVTGCLNHAELGLLLPMSSVSIVASKAAEAFGMVSVEALSAGVFPLMVYHSGVKDVLDKIKETEPEFEALMNIPVVPGGDFKANDAKHLMEVLPGKITRALEYIYPAGASLEEHQLNRSKIARKMRKVAEDNWAWDGICHTLAHF